jgi:hypothetical protein
MTAKSIVDNRYYMGMRVVLRRQSNTIYKWRGTLRRDDSRRYNLEVKILIIWR